MFLAVHVMKNIGPQYRLTGPNLVCVLGLFMWLFVCVFIIARFCEC